MDFLNICKSRYSCRGFSEEDIEQCDIEYIKECILNVPSARNIQPYTIIETDGEVLKKAICCTQIGGANPWASTAKSLWVIVEEPFDGMKSFSEIDCGILIATACYSAEAKNIGTVIIGRYDEIALKELLNIPENKRILLCLAMGKKEASPRNPKKKDKEELFKLDRYHE